MRYFFHVHDGRSAPDVDGVEIPTFEEATHLAVETAGVLIKEGACTFWSAGEWRMVVTDAEGLTMFELEFNGTLSPAARQIQLLARPANDS